MATREEVKLAGAILREPEGISLEDWQQMIANAPFLRVMESVSGINPITGEAREYRRPHAAYLILEGTQVGSVVWHCTHLQVIGELGAVSDPAKYLADLLGGQFVIAEELPGRLESMERYNFRG